MARSLELNKGSRFVILASICIVVGALYFAQAVLIPLALSLLLSFLLAPLVLQVAQQRAQVRDQWLKLETRLRKWSDHSIAAQHRARPRGFAGP